MNSNDQLEIIEQEMITSYFTEDSLVKCLDGKNRNMKEMKESFDRNESLWVYSYDIKGATVRPNEVRDVIKLDSSPKFLCIARVTLDDGYAIEVDPYHRFLTRNGEFIAANELYEDDSLMPMYWEYRLIGIPTPDTTDPNGYECIISPICKFTYRLVSNEFYEVPPRYHRHHIDCNHNNNNPDNIMILSASEHSLIHSNLNPDGENYHQYIIDHWSDGKRDKFVKKPVGYDDRINIDFTDNISVRVKDRGKLLKRAKEIIDSGNDLNIDSFLNSYSSNKNPSVRRRSMKHVYRYWESFDDFVEEARHYNHKVASVEFIYRNDLTDVYTITLDNYGNFCMPTNNGGIFIHQ